jgi:hypothetical protein
MFYLHTKEKEGDRALTLGPNALRMISGRSPTKEWQTFLQVRMFDQNAETN